MTKPISAIAGLLMAGTALWGCGIDDSLKSPTEEMPTTYTVQIDVQPPTSLRTEDTWGYWTTPVQAVFTTSFEAEHAEESEHEAEVEEHEGALFAIGHATSEGIGIDLDAGEAYAPWVAGHDGMEQVPLNGETHHLSVRLEDAINGHAPHGFSDIAGAVVHLEVVVNGVEEEIELRPVQGAHGLRYEANSSIPLGAHDITVHITPAGLLWSPETKDRWTGSVEAAITGYDISSGVASGSIDVDSMRVTIRAGEPKQYGALGMGHVPMSGDETVNFSVRLEDMHTPASGEGSLLAHCWVGALVTNAETGASYRATLYPTYGVDGFHYGGNVMLPGNMSGAAGSVPMDDGHGDDGH